MRWGRVALAALAVTVFNAVYAMLTCGWLFSWVYKIPPTAVWKPDSAYSGMFWVTLYLGNYVLGVILAAVYGWIYKGLPSDCRTCNGASYGLIVWLIGMLPGMFATYMFMNVARTVVIYWTISGLVSLLISGMIIGWIYGKPAEAK